MKIETNCPVCEGNRLEQLTSYTFVRESGRTDVARRLIKYYLDYFADADTKAKVVVDKCASCGFIFTNPRLSEQDLIKKYGILAEGEKARRSGVPPNLNKRRSRVANLVQSYLEKQGKSTGGAILDQGGAEGFLLTPLIDLGHRGYVVDYIDYPKEDDRIVYLGKTAEASGGPGHYDFIFLFHVLEHVADPVSMIARLAKQLTANGMLYVEVPLGAWLEWNDLREPLTHINFFSEQSLAAVAEASGLGIVEIFTDWQFSAHKTKAPCINMILGRQVATRYYAVKTTVQQMQPLSQLWPALRAHPRYYGKNMIKALM